MDADDKLLMDLDCMPDAVPSWKKRRAFRNLVAAMLLDVLGLLQYVSRTWDPVRLQ